MWYLNPDTVFRKTETLLEFLQLRKLLSCFNCFSHRTQIPSEGIKCHCYLLPWQVSVEKYLGAISKLDLWKGYYINENKKIPFQAVCYYYC